MPILTLSVVLVLIPGTSQDGGQAIIHVVLH